MDVPKQQFPHLLKIMTKEQLQAIIEIMYNVVQGVCTISEANTSILSKHKHLIRSKDQHCLKENKTVVKNKKHLTYFYFKPTTTVSR